MSAQANISPLVFFFLNSSERHVLVKSTINLLHYRREEAVVSVVHPPQHMGGGELISSLH